MVLPRPVILGAEEPYRFYLLRLSDEGDEFLTQFQKAIGGKHVLRGWNLEALKFADFVLMIKGADHDGRVRLPEFFVLASLAFDGQRLRLGTVGDVGGILHAARTSLQPTIGIGDHAATVLLCGILGDKFVLNQFKVTLALDFRRRVHKDLDAVDRGGVFARHHHCIEGPVAKSGAADLETTLPGKRSDAGVGDLHREKIIVFPGDRIFAYVAEALRLGIVVNV